MRRRRSTTTLVGFVLGVAIGVVIGVVVGSSKLAYDVAYPLLIGFSSIPKIAVVPIFVAVVRRRARCRRCSPR